MNDEYSELPSIPQAITTEDAREAENSSAKNAYGCYAYQSVQQLRGLLSSNGNNVLSSPADNRYYYYTTQADLRPRQNSMASEKTANSDFDFGQSRAKQELVFPKGEVSTQQQFPPRHSVDECSTPALTTVTSTTLACTSSVVPSDASSLKRKSTSAITNGNSSPINSVFVRADNSNWAFSNYVEQFCGSYPLNNTSPLDNPEARAMDFTSNRLSEANTPGADMQTESMNSVLAHQWHQRREKLPATRDTTFYTEWQINRPLVVNTAEIQKRKLQLLRATAEEQLGRANLRKKNSTPRQTKREKHEEQQQQHHLYRLHQAQQPNHLRSLTPNSLSSSRHFAHSPLSLNSSSAYKQQTFPSNQSEQTQMRHALLSSSNNSSYNFASQLQQQQLLMQAIQQQHLQQMLTQHHQPDFFEKLQELHQQSYHETLQENMSRHKSTPGSRQVSKKRKSQQHAPQEIADDKENASENSSEAALVIDESAIAPSSVQLQDSKRDEDSKSKHCNAEGQVKESVIENLGDVKKLSGEKSLKSDKSIDERSTSSAAGPSGMWFNNLAMLQDWLKTQQQHFSKNESGAVQYGNSASE